MSASPDELPERTNADEDPEAEPPWTPIKPHEFQVFELKALGLLRTHPDVSRTPNWIGRLSEHIEHGVSEPRPKDYVRALKRAPERVMVRSVGTVGASDYRYDSESQKVIQRSFSEGFQHDAGSDEPIRVKKISPKMAEDLLRECHLIPVVHWGTDLEQEFDRYREWQRGQL